MVVDDAAGFKCTSTGTVRCENAQLVKLSLSLKSLGKELALYILNPSNHRSSRTGDTSINGKCVIEGPFTSGVAYDH